jgi:geranylgeranyl reductase family protein
MSCDIIIVGAGPAGCAAAYDLARAGKRVLLLDKRSFPRPKACACGLTRKTLAALRYPVDAVVERVCHEIVLQQNAPERKHREVRVKTRQPICAMAVRENFDNYCLQQTLASAANGGSIMLRKIETIAALGEFATHIELRLETAEGQETISAPVLIGADGSNGQIRRLTELTSAAANETPTASAEATTRQDGFALEASIPYSALPATLPQGDRPHDLVFDFAPLAGGYGWLFPKGDHINIGIGAFAPAAPGEGNKPARLKAVTRLLLAEYVHHKLGLELSALDPATCRVTGQHLGMGGQAYKPSGRVLLVGDAAGLVDPLTGEGIHSAIVSGQAAAAAILEACTENARAENARAATVGSAAIAAAYARMLSPLLDTLAFSHRAARAFYAAPERGFRVMRTPILRGLVLKTYADGLPHTKLLGALARLVA